MSDQAGGVRLLRAANEPETFRRARFAKDVLTIAVTSGKGGVGKTQLSANLAVSMVQMGLKVVMLDADVGLASLDLALGVSPGADLLSVVRGKSSMGEIVVTSRSGVQLVPACPGRYEMANMDARERSLLLSSLRDLALDYDALIIDTGAGIGVNAVEFASIADEVLLVATTDPTSLRDAYAMAKVLHRRYGLDRMHFVASQVRGDLEGIEVYERLVAIVRRFLTLDLGYLGCVPRDESVPRSVSSGEPYILSSPRSFASRSIQQIVKRLTLEPKQRGVC